MQEVVSECRHMKNLFYVRELLKIELDDWVAERSDGKTLDGPEEIMDVVTNLSIIDDCITNIYSKKKVLEEIHHV